MTLLIDQSFATSQIHTPLSEGWVTPDVHTEVRPRLAASDVGPGDIALIQAPEASLLATSHVIVPEFAVVLDGISAITMRTNVRPDDIEATPIRLHETGPTAAVLVRALLRSFYGITGEGFVTSDTEEGAADAQIRVYDGLLSLMEDESGHQEDLARAWFILTARAVVSHVVVAGTDAVARGIDAELGALRALRDTGIERRRDVRSLLAAGIDLDRERLAEVTNLIRYELTPDDRLSLADLLARGTWDSPYTRALPPFLDDLPGADSEPDS